MSKPGVTQGLTRGGLGIRAGLRAALYEPTPFIRAPARKQLPSKFSDELVLAVRTMREVDGRTYDSICARFNLTRSQTRFICSYVSRAHLVPAAALAIDPKHFVGR